MASSSSAQRDPSMEEILASIRKIIEEGEEPVTPREPRESFEPAVIGPAANDVARTPVLAAVAAEPPASTPVAGSETDDELHLADFDFDMADEAEPASVSGLRGALISEAPRRQVAASFTELTEALAASRRRSLDDIAEEVLRPMLQDWLDNNLPTLVERLVREEIERVARGG